MQVFAANLGEFRTLLATDGFHTRAVGEKFVELGKRFQVVPASGTAILVADKLQLLY